MSKDTIKRLNEIDALIKAARARGDWREALALYADWSFVLRQSMR